MENLHQAVAQKEILERSDFRTWKGSNLTVSLIVKQFVFDIKLWSFFSFVLEQPTHCAICIIIVTFFTKGVYSDPYIVI